MRAAWSTVMRAKVGCRGSVRQNEHHTLPGAHAAAVLLWKLQRPARLDLVGVANEVGVGRMDLLPLRRVAVRVLRDLRQRVSRLDGVAAPAGDAGAAGRDLHFYMVGDLADLAYDRLLGLALVFFAGDGAVDGGRAADVLHLEVRDLHASAMQSLADVCL